MLIKVGNGEQVVKRAFWLAWNASQVVGMGVLQDNPRATEDDVWECVGKVGLNEFSADYLFGRMMKMFLGLDQNEIKTPTRDLSLDYQSWCGTYASYEDLVHAAIASVEE